MDEKITSSTYLLRSLRIEVKRARTRGSFMHHVFAVTQLVSGSGKWTNISWGTLLVWIKISFSSA
jgi:hypothetical protein